MKRRLLAVVCVTASLLTACGALPGSGAQRRTVTVWLMKDSASKEFLKRFTEDFEDRHGDLRLDIRIQEWTGIGEKVQAALKAEDEAVPDVIEVGNTQVAQYVDGGGLSDLTLESMRDWGMNDWLPGLAGPGRIDTRQFGIPWYAANRVVIYRKDLFAGAGIKQPPKTREQWLTDTERLNADGNQGIYLAGQDWYTLSGFIWDEGGDLAEESSSGHWEGSLGTPPPCAAWTSTGVFRHSAKAPWTPTRNTRRSRECSRRGGSPRSWPCPDSSRPSSGRTRTSRASWASSRSPARPPRRPARSSPAGPTSWCPRTPTTAPAPPTSSPPSSAPSGRRSWPGR